MLYVLNLLYFEGYGTMVQPPHPYPPEQAQLMIPPWTDCTKCSRMRAPDSRWSHASRCHPPPPPVPNAKGPEANNGDA